MEKVLFLSEHSHLGSGGIENHIQNIGKVLEYQGYNIVYMSAEEMSGKHFLDKKVISDKLIKEKLQSIAPDIIHVHGFSSFFVAQSIKLSKSILPNTKLVYTPHYHPFRYHTRPLLAELFFYLLLKPNLKNVDTLIVLTEFEKDFFVSFLSAEKISVVPNGISVDDTNIDKKKPTKNKLLFVGRDDHNKRLDFILAQRDYFIQRKIFCDIVTDTDHISDDVFTFYRNLSRSELNVLYEKSMIVIVPSKYEAFSIVALEAMSFGSPILISDRVQIQTYLNDRDMFNQVFKYNDPKDFQKKLERIVNMDISLYEKYSHQNIVFSRRFSWETIVEKILSIYEKGAKRE